MKTIYKDYCSRCKAKDCGLTPTTKKINKDGDTVWYNQCYTCANERQRRNYAKNKERYRQYVYDSIARYPEKHKARIKLNNALKAGKIIKPSKCEECDLEAKRIEADHEDYSKPFKVTWLCTPCHNKRKRVC